MAGLAEAGGGIRWADYLGPIRSRDYRYYLASAFAFSFGIWLQLTALGWVALELTDSAFLVTLANVFWFIPFFVLALPAGVLADRLDRRLILIVVRSVGAVIVAVMAYLAFAGLLTYPLLLGLTLLAGTTVILDLPARQSFVAMLVKPSELVNAMAMVSMEGSISRLAGPLLAGLALSTVGAGGAFGAFALLNLLFVAFMLMVRTSGAVERTAGSSPARELTEGLRYIREHRDVMALVLVSVLTGSVGWVYLALMPVVTKEVLDGGAVTLGILGMAVGVGAMPGGMFLAFAPDLRSPGRAFVGGLLLWGVAVMLFAYSPWVATSLLALGVAGLGFTMQIVLVRGMLLRVVDREFHGRVMGAMNLTWGANIVGTLAAGWLAEVLGVSIAVALSGALIVVAALGIVAWHPRLLRL